jgi:uncharacterized protein
LPGAQEVINSMIKLKSTQVFNFTIFILVDFNPMITGSFVIKKSQLIVNVAKLKKINLILIYVCNMRYQLFLIFILSFMLSCNGQQKHTNTKTMNKLVESSSPYLKQHADNPVHWQEWGEEALNMAKKQNKPIIISIGYAACHWCHVMEHESFSNDEVADYMNENFICIKVDREERPDIDQIYMNAVQLISGNGGWPLNAFALPDGRPFYAGTYFNKQRWLDLLKQISDLYINNHQKVIGYAEELTAGINRNQLDIILQEGDNNFEPDVYSSLKDVWIKQVDTKYGGFSRAPKFPLPIAWEFLLQYNYLTGDEESLVAVNNTLNEMARGGIYDQIGGGFARYSVDAYWKVPHFEKMLYDNAQLVSLYSHAYQITNNVRYKEVIEQTLEFVARELTSTESGFYSSLNADSEGEEGKYYIFTFDEINNIVDEKYWKIIIDYYQITSKGNWEHGNNILLPVSSKEEFAEKHNIKLMEFNTILNSVNKQLLTYRQNRERPSTDSKILTAWNSLMITAYIDAYKALGKEEYLNIAIKNADFLVDNMLMEDGGLLRNYMDGKATISAFHDDYSLFANACIELYQVTFNKRWLDLAELLVSYCTNHFYDTESGMYYYTSNLSESLIARKFELADNVIPSSNSVMAIVLFKLSHYFDSAEYMEMAIKMTQHHIKSIKESGPWYSNWALLYGNLCFNAIEVAIVGENFKPAKNSIQKHFLPTAIFLGGNEENLPLLENKKVDDRTMIYVCRSKVCKLPVENPEDALLQINPGKNQHQ